MDMEKHRKANYKNCVVPMCENNTKTAPDKVYFLMPRDASIRKKWCKAMRRDNVSCLSPLYCCEDHFNAAIKRKRQALVEEALAEAALSDTTLTKAGPSRVSISEADLLEAGPSTASIPYHMDIELNAENKIDGEATSKVEMKRISAKKGRPRKQILTEKSESETTDRTAQIEDHEPLQVVDDSTVMMFDQPDDSSPSQGDYRLTHPVVQLTCQETMNSDTDTAEDDIQQEVEEESQQDWKIDIEELSVQEEPEVSIPDTWPAETEDQVLQEQPGYPVDTEPENMLVIKDCEPNEDVPLSVEQPLSIRKNNLNTQLHTIILNVYRFLDKEYQLLKGQCCQTCDLSPLANIARRTATAVGVTQKTVAEALKTEKTNSICLDHNYHSISQNKQSNTKGARIPKRKKTRRKAWIPVKRRRTQPIAVTEGHSMLPKRKKTKDIVDETNNSPPHHDPTPPEATETEFKTEPVDDNWQNELEEDPLRTESEAVVHYEAPDGTQTVLHRALVEREQTQEVDPLETESSSGLVKPFTTLGGDIKIEPENVNMEPYDYSASDPTPLDVKREPPED